MTGMKGFREAIERAKTRAGGQRDFLPYAIFEEISSPYVTAAAWVCSFPLSLTDDLAIRLLDFVSTRLSARSGDTAGVLGDMAPVLIDILRSSHLVINGSDGRWRYEQGARDYFLRYTKMREGLAKEIHRWLLDYYSRISLPPQTKGEAWTQRIRTTYHRTPLEPETGAREYTQLLGDYGGIVFRERVSTLVREQADWLEDYSVGVLFYQGMAYYKEGLFERARGFFEQIHDRGMADPRYYTQVAVARHLLGNIIEHGAEYDSAFVEMLYRDSLDIGRILEDARHVAHVEHSLGDLLARRDDPKSLDEAENLLRHSLAYDEEDKHNLASVELSLGELLLKKGSDRYSEAIQRFERGLEGAREYHLRVRLYLGLGRVLVKRGRDEDWEAAEQAFAKALDLSRENENTGLEVQALRGMLSLATAEQDWTARSRIRQQLYRARLKNSVELAEDKQWGDATDAYRELAELGAESDDAQAVAGANVSLGRAYLEQKEFELARAVFEKALSADLDESTEAEALLGLGTVLVNTQSWEEALDPLQDSLTVLTRLGEFAKVAQCNAQLGEAYIGLSTPDSALRNLEAAHKSFEQLGEMYEAAKIAIHLAHVLDQQHNYREALAYARWGLEELLKLGHEDTYDAEDTVSSLKRKVAQAREQTAHRLEELVALQAVEPLIAALNDRDEWGRSRAVEALGKLGDAGAVEPLLAALKDRSEDVRQSATRSLGDIWELPALTALGSSDWHVRWESTQTLGELGEVRAVEPLIATLKDSEWSVRRGATQALGKLGDTQAVEPLIATLKDMSKDVRRSAIRSLGEIWQLPGLVELGNDDQQVRRRAAQTLEELGDVRAVEPLIATLKDSHEGVRQKAVEALGKLGEPAAEPLVAVYLGSSTAMAKQMANVLKKLGEPAVPPLIAALKDADGGVRRRAAEALGKLGDARAVEPFIAALKDSDESVRRRAAEALGKLGDARAVEPLIAALKDADGGVRRRATESLGELGESAVEPLIAAFEDDNWDVRRRAAEALGRLGKPAVGPLIDALEDDSWDVRRRVAEALGKLGDTQAVEPLLTVLEDSNWNVRRRAAEALGRLRDVRAVEPLTIALKDGDWEVRLASAEALGKLGDVQAVEPLITALKDSNWTVRGRAAQALGELRDARAVEPLVATFNDRNEDVRRSAIWSLGEIWELPSLTKLGDKSWRVRQGAAQKLGDLAAQTQDAEFCYRVSLPLIAALKDSDWHVRRRTAQALGKLGARAEDAKLRAQVVTSLIAALRDSYASVSEQAVNALGKLGEPAVEPLIMVALKDSDENMRQRAAQALGRLGEPAVEPLIAALKDSDRDGRQRAAEMLGRLRDPRAVEPLIATLKDSASSVRLSAAEALVKLGVARAVKLLIRPKG